MREEPGIRLSSLNDSRPHFPDPIVRNLLLFGRLLRRAGVDIHHGRMLDALRAIELVGVRSRDDVRGALAALLVHRQEDLPRFHAAFDAFFRRAAARRPLAGDDPGADAVRDREGKQTATPQTMQVGVELPDDTAAPERLIGAYSAGEVFRTRDFGTFSDAELLRARLLLEQVPWQLGHRRTRRWQRARRGAIDLRPIIRRIITRGDLPDLPRRRRRTVPRPLVLLADVSGSMERYSRILLHFVYALAQADSHVESFVFATRLTRLTPRLARRMEGDALAQVVRGVQDWGGGTRMGEALRMFNTRWARRVMRHGPIVLIVSDGWDRGEPDALVRELTRLRRSCRRLIWLNPLLGQADYEPLTRGMQAALKVVDDFLPAHNLASLEQLAAHLRHLDDAPRARAAGRPRAAGYVTNRVLPHADPPR